MLGTLHELINCKKGTYIDWGNVKTLFGSY